MPAVDRDEALAAFNARQMQGYEPTEEDKAGMRAMQGDELIAFCYRPRLNLGAWLSVMLGLPIEDRHL